MNEPKRRGRPTKAEAAAKAALAESMRMDPPPDVIKRQIADAAYAVLGAPVREILDPTPRDPAAAGITFDAGDARVPPVYVEEVTPAGVIVITETPDIDRAQAYAMRVWSGQSNELKRAERIARCERALQGQNLPTDDVKYPGGDDGEEWTAEDMQPVTWRKAQA